MFNQTEFIEACRAEAGSPGAHKRIRDLLATALTDREGVLAQLGAPERAGFDLLYRSDDLTIINFVWAPGMELFAHNHNMWAVIGIYAGVEENVFYVRDGDRIVEQNRKTLETGDVSMLGRDVIHAVANPTDRSTGGLHIYGGDFVEVERSQWDMGSGQESRYDMDEVKEVFAEANRAWHGATR